MKRYASLLARTVLAVAGLLYVLLSLTWADYVLLPEGFVVGEGVVLDEEIELNVTRIDRAGVETAAEPESGIGPRRWIWGQLDRDETSPQFHESIQRTLGSANLWYVLAGLLAVGTVYPVQVVRWLILLRCRGLDVKWGRAFRLTMVGCFFNLCMPGTTGGDVLKAWYAAKNSERRGTAVISVILDRLTGLFGLVVFAGVAGLFILGDPLGRRITLYIWLGIAAVIAASAVYFSRRIRKSLGIDAIMRRFQEEHLLNRIDRTVSAYSDHKLAVLAAVLVSLPVQLALSWATAMAGYGLGIDPDRAPLLLMMVVTPVVFLVGAMPITFQGVGVMEWTAGQLLIPTGAATFNQIVGMLLLARLFMVFYSLLGSLYLLRGDIHLQSVKPLDEAAPMADGV